MRELQGGLQQQAGRGGERRARCWVGRRLQPGGAAWRQRSTASARQRHSATSTHPPTCPAGAAASAGPWASSKLRSQGARRAACCGWRCSRSTSCSSSATTCAALSLATLLSIVVSLPADRCAKEHQHRSFSRAAAINRGGGAARGGWPWWMHKPRRCGLAAAVQRAHLPQTGPARVPPRHGHSMPGPAALQEGGVAAGAQCVQSRAACRRQPALVAARRGVKGAQHPTDTAAQQVSCTPATLLPSM